MDIPQTIDLNKTALARIVAGLFALLGLTSGALPGRISRELYRDIMRALRPAESAVRRLIVIVTRFMKAKAPPARPAPAGLAGAGHRNPRLAFQLFDARQRFLPQQIQPEKSARPGPRITFFGDGASRTISYPPAPKPAGDGLTEAAGLMRRLSALKAALDNLPHQARRLTRALLRRQTSPRLKLRGPLRPGHAPGFRRRGRLEVDQVLRECDWLARELLPPDTS